ncbi:MAG TPA: phosphoribosylformylglycinamidine synthase [Candidatus Fimenecus stercoravium]|nr:phosphoribosylformylglycinamidine synthase [Candidatus Fimenecus stercoravium]
MVYRIYVEKKKQFADEAAALLSDIRTLLMIDTVTDLRLFNRYDVENIDEDLFKACEKTVFSEPQLDNTYAHLPQCDGTVFAVEFLPGQFDQRADSCAQCIQIVSQGEKPTVRTAKVYMLFGKITPAQLAAVKKYVINPVESREASLDRADTLQIPYTVPTEVETLTGFTSLSEKELADFVQKYALAMDNADIAFCQDYFKSEHRDPTITEIRMIDTYWSDHCRHTTFLTTIDGVEIDDPTVQAAYDRYIAIRKALGRTKPQNLMDLATIGARYLKHTGQLKNLDESDEINACTVKIKVDVDGEEEDWLFLFKNETHNHPTEIEPFGGAATCIGGAIRDPLSGRGYVYQAMRVTGAANPLKPVKDTMTGKLPQRKLVTTAAAGYSSYGNQIGLATGQVDEIYHEGYVAKRMEIGAVVGAVPAKNVRREVPQPGDVVVLLGGRTGRDGCGGATGSSKSHNLSSLEHCGAEVQKGNAPEERKLQRLFRNPEAAKLIKRCNDFGAGGVSVAIGELADGLHIDLNKVPKKYEGLDGTELAISESQERMAVVLGKADADRFLTLAAEENLEATVVAEVVAEPRLTMEWNGKKIVDISREFLNSNGAEKHTRVHVCAAQPITREVPGKTNEEKLFNLAQDLNVCSKRGLAERFDSTIGANTVLMPFGGKYQLTPAQSMAAKLPVLKGDTKTCSLMAWGFNPFITEKNPYLGAYYAVVESVAKLVATGADLATCYLTFQEYFERMTEDATRWGKPAAALLGALTAQLELGLGSIGGKDSMSGTFEDIDVPPTLVSFAVSVCNSDNVISPEFKLPGSKVYYIEPERNTDGTLNTESLLRVFETVSKLIAEKKVLSAFTPTYGGIAEGLMKSAFGNHIGFKLDRMFPQDKLYAYNYGAFVLEAAEDLEGLTLLGETTYDYALKVGIETVDLQALCDAYENKLESVFACNIKTDDKPVKEISFTSESRVAPKIGTAKPKVLIPVFPGTNCEYDTARALERAGAEPQVMVIRNLSAKDIADSAAAFAKAMETAQIVFIPGGFSGGDEPDGSGKFITAFFRNPAVKEEVHRLLQQRDGLMAGICNGFQALIKLGLVPYGEIIEPRADTPTLTFNTIGRHQSRLVTTRVASNKSPWLSACKVGDLHTVPISHGEGRFVCPAELMEQLIQNGQIATQYVDEHGKPTMNIRYNPNGSFLAVEGITSPDGRVFGKMGHSERYSDNVYKNVDGIKDNGMFRNAVDYFKI